MTGRAMLYHGTIMQDKVLSVDHNAVQGNNPRTLQGFCMLIREFAIGKPMVGISSISGKNVLNVFPRRK